MLAVPARTNRSHLLSIYRNIVCANIWVFLPGSIPSLVKGSRSIRVRSLVKGSRPSLLSSLRELNPHTDDSWSLSSQTCYLLSRLCRGASTFEGSGEHMIACLLPHCSDGWPSVMILLVSQRGLCSARFIVYRWRCFTSERAHSNAWLGWCAWSDWEHRLLHSRCIVKSARALWGLGVTASLEVHSKECMSSLRARSYWGHTLLKVYVISVIYDDISNLWFSNLWYQ